MTAGHSLSSSSASSSSSIYKELSGIGLVFLFWHLPFQYLKTG